MNRIDRLAHLLSTSSRIAQPEDKLEYRPKENVRPPTGDVALGAHIYPDDDDLEDDDDDLDHIEEGEEKDTLLFGGDKKDFRDLDKDEERVGRDTLRKSRLKLLAGMIWAQLGEADAVVEESAPNELSVRVQDLSWKVTVDEDGRVTISGFDSGAEQFVGEVPEENAEAQIVKISDGIHQLIAEDIDRKSEPVEPPVHFGPEDTGEIENLPGEETGAPPPPAAPGGDQGTTLDFGGAPPPPAPGGAPPPGGAPTGGEMPFGLEGAAPPPGGAPPPPPSPGGGGAPAPPFPTASRRRMRLQRRVVRVATARLETVSNQLESIGEGLGDDGEEVFSKLADRVRTVVDLMY
jgi:hypothetical protein